MTERDWYTTAEAAIALNLTHSGVQQAIKRGALTPTRIHRRLNIISSAELEHYRRHHRQFHRPRRKVMHHNGATPPCHEMTIDASQL